jgi:hypothetical protein
VRVVHDGGGPSGSPSATSKLFKADAITTPNADSVALVASTSTCR